MGSNIPNIMSKLESNGTYKWNGEVLNNTFASIDISHIKIILFIPPATCANTSAT